MRLLDIRSCNSPCDGNMSFEGLKTSWGSKVPKKTWLICGYFARDDSFKDNKIEVKIKRSVLNVLSLALL